MAVLYHVNREFKQQRRRRLRKRHLKSEFALPQTLSRLGTSHKVQGRVGYEKLGGSLFFNTLKRVGQEK